MIRKIILLVVLAFWPDVLAAQSDTESQTMEFTVGEFALVEGTVPPSTGWQKDVNPKIYQLGSVDWSFGAYHAMTGRFVFAGEDVGEGANALYLIGTRNQFRVRLNGEEIYRNYARLDDHKLSWNRPHLILLPAGAINPQTNEIRIETVSQEAIGIGRVIIGPATKLQDFYASQFFWRITAPAFANYAMLLIGALVLLYWLRRKHETELLFLALAAITWFIRYHHYYADRVPFDPALFSYLSENANYYGSAFTAAFYLHFLKFRYRNQITTALLAIGLVLSATYYFNSPNFYFFYLPTFVITFGLFVTAVANLVRYRDVENGALALAMLVATIFGVVDAYYGYTYGGNGSAIYLSVFTGIMYALAFLLSFGKRAIDAFYSSESANIVLEQKIAETRADLARSEADRQQLVVETAIANEHGRLMQEMHDGIGSNLITALAVAREQHMPESTIKTLKSALDDLKITVDSLEPVEGDIIALIGNLRHRMAADLKHAGINCKWEVGHCEPLVWLDASNALHVLRIMQEAIGNVLSHSQATELTIGCKERTQDGIEGIESFVVDNGHGFAFEAANEGKGLRNMQARAQSLHGNLRCISARNMGCTITLWLPYQRVTPT